MSRFSIAERMASFSHAFWGFIDLLRSQHNARIHLLATILVIALASWLKLDRTDWIALLVAIALVWVTEALNTALEYLADAAVPEHHPLIGKAKDVAASAVLIASLVAAVIGLLVFLPALLPELFAG
ncbi:MAG: diacylglycerol kinase family protein [Halieaceae bacterium]|nr:diacylglycerol kinase family protein [Halieaceae bacterium]